MDTLMASIMTLWETWDRSTIMPSRFISFTMVCKQAAVNVVSVELALSFKSKGTG
jgi:hypothetical protein